MIWRDAIHLGWSNLRQTPLRTALTVTGVAIGIGTLVCMFGFGLGLQRLNTEEISRYRFLNAIQVLPMDMGIPVGARNAKERPPKAAALNESALAAIRKLPGVSAATPVVQFPVELKRGDRSRSGLGRSFEPSVDAANPLYKLTAGRFFRDAHAREVVVTGAALTALGFKDPRQAAGREITLAILSTESAGGGAGPFGAPLPSFAIQKKEVPVRVAGVLEDAEGPFGNPLLRMELLLPLGTARDLGLDRLVALQQMMRNPSARNDYTLAEVRTNQLADGPRVEKAIQKMGFRTVSLTSILEEVNKVFVIMDAVLGAIGSVSLLVACLGIVNIMIIAVLERRKEIGVMKSVGARRWDVKEQFFVEGALIGLMGGAGGVVLGWAVSQVINFGLNLYIKQQGVKPQVLFAFPLWLILAALALAVGVSLASALYPAARAARLDPVESLRYE